jgi:hypothetical protein
MVTGAATAAEPPVPASHKAMPVTSVTPMMINLGQYDCMTRLNR